MITVITTNVLCYYFLIIWCQNVYSETMGATDFTNNSPPEDGLKMIESRHKLGSTFSLKCNDDRITNKSNIQWHFKHCNNSFLEGLSCHHYAGAEANGADGWVDFKYIRGNDKLDIFDSTRKNTGLYRCLYENRVVKKFVVEIVSEVHRGPPPEVLSIIPTNSTLEPNSQLVITCNTTSVTFPEIRWFKECVGKKCVVRENGFCYCSISFSNNSTHSLQNNIYLSKLNIPNVRNIDSGIYACLVMSLYGQDYKSVTIKVLGFDDVGKDHTFFSLLFFIPLALVSIPFIVWFCCFRHKKKNINTITRKQQKQLINRVVQVDLLL